MKQDKILTKIDVKHIAELASLPLKEEEIHKFEKQLARIVEYINTLNQLDTSNVKPTAQVTDLVNITRNDNFTDDCLSQKDAISNATSHNGLFQVEQILEEK